MNHGTSLVAILGLAAILGVVISITFPGKKTEVLVSARKSKIALNIVDGKTKTIDEVINHAKTRSR